MNGVFNRCITATALFLLFASRVLSAEQNVAEPGFDDTPPVLEDNLPPNPLSAEAIDQELRDFQEYGDNTLVRLNLDLGMRPFNSKRFELINTMRHRPDAVTIDGQAIRLKHPERVATFYENGRYPTVWTREDAPTPLVMQLQRAIGASGDDALNPAAYHQHIIAVLSQGSDYQDIIALEILMTDAYLSLAGDLADGLVDPRLIDPAWNAGKMSDAALGAILAGGVLEQDIITPLARFNANDWQYQTLKQYYILLRDSFIGGAPVNTDDLIINMERLRWMPEERGETHIIVNIPAYRVSMVHDGKRVYQSRAIVGRRDRRTPRFTDHLRYIVMSPSWTVPPMIMKQDKLPRLRRDPTIYDKSFEAILPDGSAVTPSAVDWNSAATAHYTLRRKPGPRNELGRVKFLFPNRYAIYLHDTPNHSLFEHKYRARSSGCIRLQKPLELADLLLADSAWTPERIRVATHRSKSKWVKLPRETAIYLVYWTAWVDFDGAVRYANDVYGLDEKLIAAYNKALTR